MLPDGTKNTMSKVVNLPIVPGTSQGSSKPVSSVASQDPVHVVATDATVRAVSQAKQLVRRHKDDPFSLSEGLGQLKAVYLAEQYNIRPNQADH